ncbi:uncharacterized protein BN788_01938 [[Eubacterium] siraeum CAG:80]|uniref:Uncharacterized protein n=1 Tax=[Eubacterium] siraeum CAG:80 TaxID=1263080 RepID=R6RBR0_9FIRM|nr:uncharacterized protein BN788_01938 [[Eubacterium] siraeum CAG:80]
MNKHNRKALMMKRALLRLKCGRGSVLFFIVAIMSVMIVLASAVYYSAVSARKQVEIRYGDEQSYQSAVSLNDLVTEYLNTKTEDAFVDAILALAPGSSLTTQGTGTDSFAKLAEGLGDYKVTVTKISGDSSDEKHTVKIETEVIVDGESSTVTSVGEFTLVSKPYSFDRFFTSTGYAPNDVFMSGMTITSTMYLDNEYSQIGGTGAPGTGNSKINIEAEIISAGTLAINNAPINADGDKTFDITVGNNLIMTFNGGQGAMNLNGGRIRVGGNLIQGTSFNYKNDTDVYVVGDFISGRPSDDSNCEIYVNGDAAFFGNETYKGKVYVNGDVYIDREVNTGDKFPGGITIGGNVYLCSGSSYFGAQTTWIKSHGIDDSRIKNYSDASIRFEAKNGENDSAYNALRANMDKARSLAGGTAAYNYIWPSDSLICESLQNVKDKINEKIGNPEYSNWNMTKKFINDDGTYTVDPINYNFDNATDPELQDARFAGTGSNKNQLIVSAEKFGQYVVMGDMRITAGTWDGYNIVFDTTMPDGKDIDMYVYLPANCYMEQTGTDQYKFSSKDSDKSKFNCFRWNNEPTGLFEGWFSVLTKGKGSVIFVVGDGVTYYAQRCLFMGHYNLLKEILPNSISADGKITETAQFTTAAVKNIMRTTDTNEKLRTVFKGDVLKKYDSSGGLHNNLFIVAINKNSDLNFSSQYNTFCGFAYAPYMTFGISSMGQGGFAMLGGLIVSDYSMPNTSLTFMATIPYDYYDRFTGSLNGKEKEDARFDYMEKLISNSGGEIGTLGSSGSRSWRKFGYN